MRTEFFVYYDSVYGSLQQRLWPSMFFKGQKCSLLLLAQCVHHYGRVAWVSHGRDATHDARTAPRLHSTDFIRQLAKPKLCKTIGLVACGGLVGIFRVLVRCFFVHP